MKIYYSGTELAARHGKDHLGRFVSEGCPEPDTWIGERGFYSEEQAAKVQNFFTQLNNLLCISDVAAELNTYSSTIRAWVAKGLFPPPTHVRKVRKYYHVSELPMLKAILETMPLRPKPFDQKAEEGFYSRKRAAKMLGMPFITFESWIVNGSIAPPSCQIGRNLYYTLDDIKAIRKKKEEYFAKRGLN